MRAEYLGIPWIIDDGLPVERGFPAYTAERVSRVARWNLERLPIPSLQSAGIAYQRDPVECDMPRPWWVVEAQGVGDCKALTAWRLAEIRARTGAWPVGRIEGSGRAGLIHVRLKDEDPSRALADAGRRLPGRRAPGAECAAWKPYRAGKSLPPWDGAEAGEPLPSHRDPALIDPVLREVLDEAQEDGLPVFLASGQRTTERQIQLWEARLSKGRARGDEVPAAWSGVERAWSRYWPWVRREWQGEGTGPALALPGTSAHERTPLSGAADLGSDRPTPEAARADLERVADIGAGRVHRPIPGEPWHFEPV